MRKSSSSSAAAAAAAAVAAVSEAEAEDEAPVAAEARAEEPPLPAAAPEEEPLPPAAVAALSSASPPPPPPTLEKRQPSVISSVYDNNSEAEEEEEENGDDEVVVEEKEQPQQPRNNDAGSATASDEINDEQVAQQTEPPQQTAEPQHGLNLSTLLQLLPPLQQCGKDEGWFLDVIDGAAAIITPLVQRLPSSAKPHNAAGKYKQGYHRSVLRCIIKHCGAVIKSKRATHNKQSTQFWALGRMDDQTNNDDNDSTSGNNNAIPTITNREVNDCLQALQTFVGDSVYRRIVFIDSNGRFFTSLPRGRRVGVVSDQKTKEHVCRLAGGDLIVNGEFSVTATMHLGLTNVPHASLCVIGCATAINAYTILAHACELADTVAMVLPAALDTLHIDRRLHLERTRQLSNTLVFNIYRCHYDVHQVLRAIVKPMNGIMSNPSSSSSSSSAAASPVAAPTTTAPAVPRISVSLLPVLTPAPERRRRRRRSRRSPSASSTSSPVSKKRKVNQTDLP